MAGNTRSAGPSFDGDARPVLLGFLVVQLFLGYEWLMSGLSKVTAGNFVSGLGDTLTDQTKDLAGPYKSFIDSVVIPNASAFGYLVLIGELAIGIVLIVASLAWMTRWSQLSTRGRTVILSLIVASGLVTIVMNVNFHLASGANHPWLLAADPFGEGIDLDSLMPIIQVVLSAVSLKYLVSMRRATRVQVGSKLSEVPAKA